MDLYRADLRPCALDFQLSIAGHGFHLHERRRARRWRPRTLDLSVRGGAVYFHVESLKVPSSVSSLLDVDGLDHGGSARWGTDIELAGPGVYLITIDADPDFTAPVPNTAPVQGRAIAELLEVRPELLVDGRRPTPAELQERIASFWLVDEPVLYIGLAGTSLRTRVRQYYRTPLGARKPHAGGWFLKTLQMLPDLWVHYAAAEVPKVSEHQLLKAFVDGTSRTARDRLHDPQHAFPFANLEWPQGTRKLHAITGADGRPEVILVSRWITDLEPPPRHLAIDSWRAAVDPRFARIASTTELRERHLA